MYSEALKIMDRNTVMYMIEEQQKEIAEKEAELARREELHAAEKETEIKKQIAQAEHYKELLKQAGISVE